MAKPTVKDDILIALLVHVSQATASTFDDPLLAKQWHYYNDGSVNARAKKGADCNVKPVWEKYTTGKKKRYCSRC